MLRVMPRWLSLAAGALVALLCLAALLFGVAWLAPRFVAVATHQGAGRTTVLVVFITCLFLLQVRRMRAARVRKRRAARAERGGPSPLNLTSGM